jgi:hypothetical protein
MFFSFPRTPAGTSDRQAVEFGVVIGEYPAWSGSRVFQRLLPERLSPEKCVDATVFSDPGFESVAERKHIL